MFFVISYSEAIDILVENRMAWHWDPDSSAFAACGPLDNKTDEELEDILHSHIRVEEQQNGFEDGLLSCVRFKIVRDHDLAKPTKSR